MKINLNGKTALISGAAQGIGQAIALKFKEAGARLILIDKCSEKLKNLASEIDSNVIACSLDVSNEKDITANLGSILKHEKRIDILVNNAATVTKRAKITELDFAEYSCGKFEWCFSSLKSCNSKNEAIRWGRNS